MGSLATARKWKKKGLGVKLARRLHMYFGLVLLPFVLLYGTTALLFNHSSWMSTSDYFRSSSEPFLAAQQDAPSEIVTQISKELSTREEFDFTGYDEDSVELVNEHIFDVEEDGFRYRYRFIPMEPKAFVQRTPTSEPTDSEFTVSPLDFAPAPSIAQLVEAIEEDHNGSEARIRSASDVRFVANINQEKWVLTCDLQTGKVTHNKFEEPRSDFNWRSYLLRLHKTRGYPRDGDSVRLGWAVAVDVMGLLMLFWGLSGIIMWWQMKPFRLTGGVLVLVGVLLCGSLGYWLYQAVYY